MCEANSCLFPHVHVYVLYIDQILLSVEKCFVSMICRTVHILHYVFVLMFIYYSSRVLCIKWYAEHSEY